MSVKFVVTHKGAPGGEKSEERVVEADEIVLGRGDAATVKLPEPTVSRAHSKITRDGALYFLEDLGSAYGTRVNGQPLPHGEKRLLRNGDVIAVGPYDVAFNRVASAPEQVPAGADATAFIARQAVKGAMKGLASGQGPYLRSMAGKDEGQRYPISDAKELVLGREDGCDIVLTDDMVSRRHAKVRRDWSGTHVEDLGSRNGVTVNKKRIAAPVTLHDGDKIEVGAARFLYLDPSEVREVGAPKAAAAAAAANDDGEGTVPHAMDDIVAAAIEAPASDAGSAAPASDAAADVAEAEPAPPGPGPRAAAPPGPPEDPAEDAEAAAEPPASQARRIVGRLPAAVSREGARHLVPIVLGVLLALGCLGFLIALLLGV